MVFSGATDVGQVQNIALWRGQRSVRMPFLPKTTHEMRASSILTFFSLLVCNHGRKMCLNQYELTL